ncbi:MAG: hypothetical protein R3B72_05925 [Polyangiaceae bacterium]
MKLKMRTLHDLADYVTGGASGVDDKRNRGANFLYRSSSALSEFFRDCETDYVHRGASRVPWTLGVLQEMNDGACSNPDLPADLIVAVVRRLMDRDDFEDYELDFDAAMQALTKSFSREGITPYIDENGVCQLRTGSSTSVSVAVEQKRWTPKDLERRQRWEGYLAAASEDEFTETLVTLLRLGGFQDIDVAGHEDKALEYGKDLWMKFLLPTGHWLYFAIQVKKGKIDAAGRTKTGRANVTEILNQVQMALDHEIDDRSVNRRVLVDHVYVVASGTITKAAKNFLGQKLDRDRRRQVIFMDRDNILDLVAKRAMEPPGNSDLADENLPF